MKYGMNLLLWTSHLTSKHFPLLEKLKKTGYDGVAKDKPAQPDFRDAYRTQLVLDAVLDSAREQKWVKVKPG